MDGEPTQKGDGMPKVYLSAEDRQRDKIIRAIGWATKGKQKDLAKVWGISQPAVSQRLKHGNITLIDLWKARGILDIDLGELVGKERKGND